ncbi:phage tail protein [Actibacterium sp. XHP0104]|uniref:phage tail protein n=1 Tax=Actibacterium sp. XHP0104 TaxID=2984335 RepID=UPI0021E77B28|nr:tail fiber protein [Actibacterium sp. XHP0104]MCV2882444.1 tail fiber protein [Actibacterium sp. XHP0104]
MTIYIGDIMLFGGTFAPSSFQMCNGQILAINQFQALFSLIGTSYGGDGHTTFALPDLRDRVPLHMGQGPGLTNRPIGSRDGADTVSLLPQHAPAHSHTMRASRDGPQASNAGLLASATIYRVQDGSALDRLDLDMVDNTPPVPAAPHENRQPYLAMNYWIAVDGVYPSRS